MMETERTDAIPPVANGAPRVRLVSQSGSVEEVIIDCRRVVTLVGSRTGCKVHLRHRRVSPVHVALVHTGTQVYAVDLVSKHGTRLNGLKMEYERLTDGDMLEVPPWMFRVDIEQPEELGEAGTHPFGLDPTPHVVALEHLASGRILRPNRDICTLGRRNGCDIIVEDRRVSRMHLLLFRYFGHPAACDLLSHNETFIGDGAVRFKVLANDDIITVGETHFGVRLLGSSVAESLGPQSHAAPPTPLRVVTDADADQIDIGGDDTTVGRPIIPSAKPNVDKG